MRSLIIIGNSTFSFRHIGCDIDHENRIRVAAFRVDLRPRASRGRSSFVIRTRVEICQWNWDYDDRERYALAQSQNF
jgi:hypothetical protein